MRREVATDYAWGLRFIDHAKSILGRFLFQEAPRLEDQKRNTDLIVLTGPGDVRVAFRARREGRYLADYGHQFTIRSSRPSGVATELDKLREGWGHYMLYGFGADRSSPADYLKAWALIDLAVFRAYPNVRGRELPNPDGTKFRAYDYGSFPPELLLGSFNLPPTSGEAVHAA
jgi:hypothetical protein